MSSKKVYIIDKLVIGYNHVVFNAAISAIIANLYQGKETVFIAEALHTKVIANKNAQINSLTYAPYQEETLPSSKVNKLIPWVKKKIGDALFINTLFKQSFKDAEAIFFTCLSASTLFFAGYKAKHSLKPVYFFLHGEVEYIYLNNLSKAKKLKGRLYESFLRGLGRNVKIIVLSEITKKRLIEDKYVDVGQIMSIEHPIIATEANIQKQVLNQQIAFGHIGTAMSQKSSQLFFELPKYHAVSIKNKLITFKLIGKLEHGFKAADKHLLEIVGAGDTSLSQSEYEVAVNSIDYAVFTFTGENYVHRISGAVMDAILFLKPVIALRHTYFNHLFETAGNIGFLCHDMNDLNECINKIANKDEHLIAQYEMQKANLELLRESLSVESSQVAMRTALNIL